MGIEEIYLNTIKAIFHKCTVNIILNTEKLKFSSKSKKKTRMPALITSNQYGGGNSTQHY